MAEAAHVLHGTPSVIVVADGSILVGGELVGWTQPDRAALIEGDPMIQREIAADFAGLCRSFPKLFRRKRPGAPQPAIRAEKAVPRCTCFEWGYGKARCPVPGHKERNP